jgi:hypothetical protein
MHCSLASCHSIPFRPNLSIPFLCTLNLCCRSDQLPSLLAPNKATEFYFRYLLFSLNKLTSAAVTAVSLRLFHTLRLFTESVKNLRVSTRGALKLTNRWNHRNVSSGRNPQFSRFDCLVEDSAAVFCDNGSQTTVNLYLFAVSEEIKKM